MLEDRTLLDAGGPPSALHKLKSLTKIVLRAPVVLAAAFGKAALRSHQKYGYAAVSFGAPLLLDELLPDAAQLARAPDAARKPAIAALADVLLARVADAIPATPVAVVSRSILDGERELSSLRRRVGVDLAGLRATGRPIAQGLAFHGLARSDRRADNPELASLDQEIGDAEEAERTVDLALRLLRRRGLVALEGTSLRVPPEAMPLLSYYARSLDPPAHRAAPSLEGDRARTAG